MHHCFSFSFLPTKHKIFYYVEKILQKNLEKKKKIQASSFGLLQYFTGGKTRLIFMNWHY